MAIEAVYEELGWVFFQCGCVGVCCLKILGISRWTSYPEHTEIKYFLHLPFRPFSVVLQLMLVSSCQRERGKLICQAALLNNFVAYC